MISTYKQKQITNYCRNLVDSMFATFNTPSMQGPNFAWQNFPNVIENFAFNNVSCIINTNKNTKAEVEIFAALTAKDFAEKLMEFKISADNQN